MEKTDQQNFEEKMKASIIEIEAQIDLLKSKGEKLKDISKETIDEQIVLLSEKNKELQVLLTNMKETSDIKWQELKLKAEAKINIYEKDAKHLLDTMNTKLDSFLSKFKQ